MTKKHTGNQQKPPVAPPLRPDTPGRLYFRLGAVFAFIWSLVLYTRTMAPSAPFWDAGEFIACAHILGVPHSPGTPLYVLIAKVFTLMPLPFSIAGRVNFLSAFTSAGAVLFLYLLAVRFLDRIIGHSETLGDTLVKVGAALSGALFVAASNTFWWNAVEAEVYSMSIFVMAFMTWLALKWEDNPKGLHATPLVFLMFYLLALTVGLHLGTILAFAGIFFLIILTPEKSFSNTEFLLACIGIAIFIGDATLYRNGLLTSWLIAIYGLVLIAYYVTKKSVFAPICAGLFLLGISVHLFLLIRSGHNPAIDEGDPQTWQRLYAVLRREQYPPTTLFPRKASFAFQLQHFNNYFQQQFQVASAYVGKLNLGSIVPIALGVWGMVDHYAKNKKTFVMLFAIFIVTSLGMIIYLNFSDAEVRERDYFYLPAFYYFGVFIAIGAGSLLGELKRALSGKGFAQMATVGLLAALLIIMPFVTTAHQYWEHDRSHDYVCREYAKNMLVGLDKNSLLFTNGDNDTFPLWYIQEVEHFRTDIRIINLSLLNTPWYIKQLRDNEPKVTITWTDADLKQLRWMRAPDGTLLQPRDIAARHILQHNSKRVPIYFAVTIPPEIYAPYRDFLEMEGLAYRVVPRKGQNMINEKVLRDNIWNKFSYLGILKDDFTRDESIYQPPYVRRLTQNYSAAFSQLAFVHVQREEYKEAVRNLEVARQISPHLEAVRDFLGVYYFEAGDTARALRYYDEEFAKDPTACDLLYRKAGIYERMGDLPSALDEVERVITHCPDRREAVESAIGISVRLGQLERAERFLDGWLAAHPEDRDMRNAWETFRRRFSADSLPDTLDGGE